MLANDWEYCQIKFQIVDDGRAATTGSGLATRLMWIQFSAVANAFGKQYIAGKSERLPLPNNSRVGLTPQKASSGQQNILEELVESLKHEGWELLPQGGGEWWERNFRRAASIQKVKKGEINRKERMIILGALTALIALSLGVFSLISQSNLSLRKFTSADLAPLSAQTSTTVGRMIVINLATNDFDPIQQTLPENMIAENLDNIKTVVWVDCDHQSNWKGANADCLVTVIDWEHQSILDEQLFAGEFTLHPVDVETHEKVELSTNAIRDSASIRDYLTSLPKN